MGKGPNGKIARIRRRQELLAVGEEGWQSLGAHQGGFERCTRGPGFAMGSVKCVTCERTGSPWGMWAVDCIAGHPFRCHESGCPRAFTTIRALAAHRREHEAGAAKREAA